MLKSQLIKSNHRVQINNRVDTHGAPDYSVIVLVSKMSTNHCEHSI
jgi:hypothetical protein